MTRRFMFAIGLTAAAGITAAVLKVAGFPRSSHGKLVIGPIRVLKRDEPRPTWTLEASGTAPIPAPPPADVLAVVRLDEPNYPTTRPLDLPADLPDAAKIVLTRPAYVDPAGNLWLTHPAGRPVAEVLAGPIADHTAVVRERVRYVRWPVGDGPVAAVVGDGDALSVVTPTHTFPRRLIDIDFARTQRVGDGIVVTNTSGGVMPPDLSDAVELKLPVDAMNANPPALAPAGDGVWAWSPWENGRPGSHGAVFVDAAGQHAHGPADGWPEKVIQIVPLADGSVLIVAAGERGPQLQTIAAANAAPASEDLRRDIEAIVRRLADPDPAARERAQRELEAQGLAAYSVLESMHDSLPPEGQIRIETLLGERFAPTLGGLRPLDGAVETIARFTGGGGVLRLSGGGIITDDAGHENTVIPATVLIRPGHAIERIDPAAVCDFVPGRQSIQWVGDELLISDPVAGPRRWIGGNLFPLLPKSWADFDTVVGIDARRRWLLTSKKRPGQSLLIDPSLPDTTPKLPVWTVDAGDGAGWTDDDWPAVKRDKRLFVLQAHGWKTDDIAHLRTAPVTRPAPRPDASANARPSDAPSTAAPPDTPLVGPAGRRFVYSPDGHVRRYAAGVDPAHGPPDADFTQDVPPAATRAWIDPAGRLILVTEGRLAVAFPEGRVPPDLADLMLHVTR